MKISNTDFIVKNLLCLVLYYGFAKYLPYSKTLACGSLHKKALMFGLQEMPKSRLAEKSQTGQSFCCGAYSRKIFLSFQL